MPRMRRTAIAVAVALSASALLSSCGTAPWQLNASASATPTPTKATVAPTITPIVNDLATGSTQRILKAGDITVTINYFSTLSMDKWTASANKPISFNMSATLGTDDGQHIYLSRVTLNPAVLGKDGVTLPAPAPLTDQATVSPGYFIKAPYSYSETFVLPAVDPAATEVVLSFTYELLLQTTPTSNDFAKQTAADTVTVAIAP
ncbi:hypothetical protein KPL76_05765 [Subtercola sp. PAMC28395]|uniref:hypothetical protein n=1 Tax=Subtercola sp. PAMC28395 TaxID=2846775 RepID=UPI001C0BB210|nr:hypothetical protein [Subtercola sp. PAMC28395]QWT24864.1 hypothetical protein KPL76_05765 [Subtercola sp. PAMC28395]